MYRMNTYSILALITFGICFAPKYRDIIEKNSSLKSTIKEFYKKLTQGIANPAISKKNIDDINTIVNTQEGSYKKIFDKEDNKLLENYENLDTINQNVSFDINYALCQSPQDVFKDLASNYKEFHSFAQLNMTPKKILDNHIISSISKTKDTYSKLIQSFTRSIKMILLL